MLNWINKDILKEELDNIHPLAYSLVRWIIASNRCHLKKLDEKEQIKGMNTKFQYYLMSGTPKQEKVFQDLKKKYGSVWAFHGSSLCNWHSIMRLGLKNMSGTSGQTNGAEYGSGVYLANYAQTSFGYIRYQTGWNHTQFGKGNLGCMALCEIVKHPTIKNQPNPYYVIKDDKIIATRYFFIYDGKGSSSLKGKTLIPPKIKF